MTENLESQLREFEDWMYEKYSRSTIQDTTRKMRFFSRQLDLSSREGLMQFLREKRREGASKGKVNEYIKYLNRWIDFKSTQEKGWEKIIYLRTTKKSFTVKYYESEQVKAILEGTKGQTVEDRRDHAMVLLALNTGLRRAEIAALKISDVHEDLVRVERGKGEKTRDVYLDPATKEVLMEFVRVRNNRDSPYVFTTRNGVVDPEYMGKIAARISGRTGIPFAWHKCRHTYARNMIRSDVDLQTLRQMLGHERLDTTGIYTTLDTGEAIERIREKKPKFFREDERFKSTKSWDSLHGLAGIETFIPLNGGIYPCFRA